MKEYLLSQVRQSPSPLQARNVTREYLQARILDSLQRSGAMIPLAFHGGTALRFLYSINRYSEDLDFALEQAPAQYDFRGYLRAIQSEFLAENYQVEVKVNDQKTVHSAFVRFIGLLHELQLSPHRDEILAVKIEVDTKPPAGATLAIAVVRRHLPLRLQHHDRATLLAGKLHAVLQRAYSKGRDLYDLFWYLSDPAWPAPNINMLNHALQQSNWKGEALTSENWRRITRRQIERLEWSKVIEDVRPFVVVEAELRHLTLENLQLLLG